MEHLIVGILAGVLTAFLTVKMHALTVAAAIEAVIIIVCSCVFGGWFGLIFLLSAYFTIALIDRFFKKRTQLIFGNMNKKSGPRDFMQVAANGIPATVCVVLYGITCHKAFLIGFTVALTEALADSIASDVGVLSKKDPVSICRFKTVPRGLSGGVSLLGSLSSAAAALFCAVLYLLFFKDVGEALIVFVFGNIGCLIDSVLGDLLQEKFSCPKCGCITEKPQHCGVDTKHAFGIYRFDNCLVNLVSNTLSALLAVLIMIW